MSSAVFLTDLQPADRAHFTIADLAREYEVTARTIRFYESEGLLAPKREGQNRIYSKRDRARLGWILRGKRVGFSLAEIRELIEMYDISGPAQQREALTGKIGERVDALKSQRRDIDATIAELEDFIDHIKTTPARGTARRTANA